MGMRVTRKNGYTLQVATNNFNPADATTYYIGAPHGGTPSSVDGNYRMYIPKAGTVSICYGVVFSATTTGTNENSTISLRKNSTTDYQISTTIDNSQTAAAFSTSSLNIPVAAGDYIELKWAAPTWVTNPTGVRISAQIYIQA